LACVFLYFANRPSRALSPRGDAAASAPWYSAVWTPFAPMPTRTNRRRVALAAADSTGVRMPRHRLITPPCSAALAFFAGLMLIQYCYSAPLWRLSIAGVIGGHWLIDEDWRVTAWVHGVSIAATAALATAMAAIGRQWVRQRSVDHVHPKQLLVSALVTIAVV